MILVIFQLQVNPDIKQYIHANFFGPDEERLSLEKIWSGSSPHIGVTAAHNPVFR